MLGPIIKPLAFVPPNLVSIVGLLPPMLFFILLMQGNYGWALVSYPFLLLDVLDGAIARINGKVTAFGGVLDSVADRVSDFLIIAAFAFAGLVRWEITAPLLLFSFLVSYMRSRGELAGKGTFSLALGLIERTERLAVIGITFLLFVLLPQPFGTTLFLEISFSLLIILSMATLGQRLATAYSRLK